MADNLKKYTQYEFYKLLGLEVRTEWVICRLKTPKEIEDIVANIEKELNFPQRSSGSEPLDIYIQRQNAVIDKQNEIIFGLRKELQLLKAANTLREANEKPKPNVNSVYQALREAKERKEKDIYKGTLRRTPRKSWGESWNDFATQAKKWCAENEFFIVLGISSIIVIGILGLFAIALPL